MKHVVGYSLSVCEISVFHGKSKAVTEVGVYLESDGDQVEVTFTFFCLLVQCFFFVLQGSRTSQMKNEQCLLFSGKSCRAVREAFKTSW